MGPRTMLGDPAPIEETWRHRARLLSGEDGDEDGGGALSFEADWSNAFRIDLCLCIRIRSFASPLAVLTESSCGGRPRKRGGDIEGAAASCSSARLERDAPIPQRDVSTHGTRRAHRFEIGHW